jgi:cell division transport system permease protein
MFERALFFAMRTRENVLLNPIGSGVTLAALSLCLLFFGANFFLYRSITTLAPPWMAESKAVVYLRSQASALDQQDLVEKLKQWPSIQEIRSVSREEARRQLEAQLGEFKGILEGIEENPLPLSLEITFETGEKKAEPAEALVGKIREFPQVEDVFYGKSSMEKLEFLSMVASLSGSWIPGSLALAVVLIVFNSVKHTLSARREELEVYDLLGATSFFTRAPFYLEGILVGTAGGFVASSILTLLVTVTHKALPVPVATPFSWKPLEMFGLTAGVVLCGTVLGWLGAWYALRRTLQT